MHYLNRLSVYCLAFATIVVITFTETTLAKDVLSAAPKDVPFTHALGMNKYKTLCSNCHGESGMGTKQGPPLMHPYYRPSHHSDLVFYRAALKGVRAHHWDFGDMPSVTGITKNDLDAIVPYIRWLQKYRGLIK